MIDYEFRKLHARTANSESLKEPTDGDDTIEKILDFIMGAIYHRIKDLREDYPDGDCPKDEMYVYVEFDGDSDPHIKLEVINRLQDMCYKVMYVTDTQEEAELLGELEEMSLEDETVMKSLNEFKDGVQEIKVSWAEAYDED